MEFVSAGIALAGVIVGAVLNSVLSERRAVAGETRASSRATEAALSGWRRETLRDTRIGLRRQIAALEAVALGDLETAHRHELAIEELDMNIALVGDIDAIRGYHELVAELRQRMGRGLPAEYAVHAATVLNALAMGLDEQEERLLRGEPLIRVDPAVAPELFAPEAIAERLDLPTRLPSIAAAEARVAMDVISRLRRRGHRGKDRPPES